MTKEKRTMESIEADAKATWDAVCNAPDGPEAMDLMIIAENANARAKLVRCCLADGSTFEAALAYCDDIEREAAERD